MRLTPAQKNGLVLIVLLFDTMLAMSVTEQATHRPVSPVWQLPLGAILLLFGMHLTRFRQEIVDERWNKWVARSPWLRRTSDGYIDPVFSAIMGGVLILLSMFMLARGVLALF